AKHLAADDEQGFIDQLLAGQPDAPAYFARMKRPNKDGPALLGERRAPRRLTADELRRGREDQTLALVDTRPVHQVHAGTVPAPMPTSPACSVRTRTAPLCSAGAGRRGC